MEAVFCEKILTQAAQKTRLNRHKHGFDRFNTTKLLTQTLLAGRAKWSFAKGVTENRTFGKLKLGQVGIRFVLSSNSLFPSVCFLIQKGNSSSSLWKSSWKLRGTFLWKQSGKI
jgi:hypothetical protein